MNRDLEEQYFDNESPEGEEDPANNTGIQDFWIII